MEMRNVPLRGIKVDPLAHELATSEGTQPYLDCLIKAYSNNAAGLEARSKSCETCRSKSDIRGVCFPHSSGHSQISRTNTWHLTFRTSLSLRGRR